MIVKALTIAGSDPSSGAGIQSDLLVFASLRVYGLSVITSITAQNTQKILSIKPLDKDIVREQLDAVFEDFGINAIKIGMVYDGEIIDLLYNYLRDVKKPIIIDPVIRSTTNTQLLKDDAYDAYKRLLELAYVITPNIPEAEILADMKIDTIDDMRKACKRFANNVIITGGHLRDKAIDILYTNNKFYEFVNEKIDKEFHGTGSIFSAALTAEIAKGFDLINACSIANRYTRHAIENSYAIGKGLFIPSLLDYVDDNMLELQRAIDIIETMPNFHLLIPETQTNFAYMKDNSIFAVKGRIVKFGRYAKAGSIAKDASKHVADALLTASKYSNFRSAINIRYDEEIIKIAKELGMKIQSYDRSKEPKEFKDKEGMSIKWGIEQAFANDKPDMVYHKGDLGKEPMIIIFGKEPMDVINKIEKILSTLQIDPNNLLP
ncbi:MAG: bifunctional hydroxymethylpyrimidine kinase/phosphomethylpyrimidine kinase [Candidatus Nitrosocaldaceae archaeon]|nr:MAG: bifunctional hydroxymethylpyrimidine kinase/phosphomethylpyrimidine kinase [Candidatus Nitrosocaldaceae archaeon]